MKTLLFLLNPNTGQATIDRVVEGARSQLRGYRLEFLEVWGPAQVVEACARLGRRCKAVVVAGGDGTLNRALPSLLKLDVPAYVIPAGTANDLARELGSSGHWQQLRQLLRSNAVRHVDVLIVNGVPFASAGGIGVGAVLCDNTQQRRERSRAFRLFLRTLRAHAYTLLGLETILRCRGYKHRVRVASNGRALEMETAALMICNQGTLAGDLEVVHDTRNDDGVFEALVMPLTGKMQLLAALASMKCGLQQQGTQWVCDRLSIEDLDGRPMLFFGDGEVLARATKFEITIARQALTMVAA